MNALEALKTRRSVRHYKPDPIPPHTVDDIVDCGRLAATARNLQPWEFIVITNAQTRRQLAERIDTGRFIADAPVCIVVFCRETKYFLEDGCAALENILLAAHGHGLGSCWVAGEKKPYTAEVATLLEVPSGFRLIGLVTIGYAAEIPPLPPKRSLAEVLHREKF